MCIETKACNISFTNMMISSTMYDKVICSLDQKVLYSCYTGHNVFAHN